MIIFLSLKKLSQLWFTFKVSKRKWGYEGKSKTRILGRESKRKEDIYHRSNNKIIGTAKNVVKINNNKKNTKGQI